VRQRPHLHEDGRSGPVQGTGNKEVEVINGFYEFRFYMFFLLV
jgi:hypothetical protein